MNAPLLIAHRDLTELVRGGRLYWMGGLLLVLLVTALAVGWQRQAESQSERARALALDYAGWVTQPERHPHDAAHQGMHVFKPEAALAMIDPGIGPYVGSTLWLRAHRQTEVKFRPAQDATGLTRFGSLSVAWVLQLLGPLVVSVLGFAAISGEREQGTLRQILSLGVSMRQLLWGKALALSALLCLLLVPAGLLASAVVLASVESGARLDSGARLAGLGVAYALYLGVFVFLALAVSAWATSSRLSLVCLLGLWIALVLVLPRLLADASRSWVPSASRREFDRRLGAELGVATRQAWQERFGVDEPFGSGVPLSQWGLGLQVHDHAGYGVMDRHFNALWDGYSRQQALQQWAGLSSPTIVIRAISMGMAGTGFDEHRAFSSAAEAQRRRMQDVISADLIEHADGHGEQHFSYRASRDLWARLPAFEYEPAGASTALGRVAPSLMVLVGAFGMSVVLAHAAASRRVVGRGGP
jgi:ABC-2 type transport system permease protein